MAVGADGRTSVLVYMISLYLQCPINLKLDLDFIDSINSQTRTLDERVHSCTVYFLHPSLQYSIVPIELFPHTISLPHCLLLKHQFVIPIKRDPSPHSNEKL
jgi:hypothetical protein